MTQDLDQQGHAATAARRKHPFDVDAFLAKPLVARVATSGPAVRPVWYLWEDGAFWWITGCYARLPELLAEDPRVALVVDSCDLKTLEVLQVTARGEAEVVPFDEARARRKLVRYLGDDEHTWPSDFREFDPDTRFVRFVPNRLIAIDLSKVRPLSRDGVEEGSASVGIVDADGTRSVRETCDCCRTPGIPCGPCARCSSCARPCGA